MSTSGECRYETRDDGSVVRLSGAWQLSTLSIVLDSLRHCIPPSGISTPVSIDGSALEAIDTAGALALWKQLDAAGAPIDDVALDGFAASPRRIVELVRDQIGATAGDAAVDSGPADGVVRNVGEGIVSMARIAVGNVEWLGRMSVALADVVRRPRRLRVSEFFVQLGQVFVSAIPVVALVSFLIGLVIAYLLGLQATQYGASIFVVDGVALGLSREFSPLIIAVILSGRSGAAFTAQLATMRLTEEIDAIRTLGLSVEQVLLVPRLLALMLSMPLLVFIGDIAGMLGAMVIADHMLDIGPTQFLERLRYALLPRHFIIGLAKAPVFAAAIAVIAFRMGMTVDRDARSIGRNTTSTVVQSIVAVIVIDSLFAVLLQAVGL